ncbi:S9 family peptidase [Candidatus Pelagibacter communis]|uniref:S9 family peptidase n=1 Tax=Pelagibacter ubique TaxID=198252 RepID=UPI00094C1952|nr:S9 family peptidase [Candidatus Pelagibacter ubique]
MKIPQLSKKSETKSCHNVTWTDDYSWVHQKNILEVLKDSSKLLPEVRKYLEEENKYTEFHLKDTKEFQKTLFNEIKGRIKLDDESLPFKDKSYEYWTKTTKKGNYSIKCRKKIGTDEIEEIWNGDKEKSKLKTEYFGVGDLEVSYNDKFLAYSLDLKGSEYFTIYVRDIKTGKLVTEKIENTSGSINFSLDDQYIFYSKLDENHRPRSIFRHQIGSSINEDLLIFEEKTKAFTVGIGISSDEKYYFINSSDHNTSEKYYFGIDEKKPDPKIIQQRKKGIIYSVNSWGGNFYMHTNEDAEDFKILISNNIESKIWETYIPSQSETMIGNLTFLNNWQIRSELRNALDKIYVKNLKTNKEEEIIFTDETVYDSSVSLMQRSRDTDDIYISYSTPKTPSRTFIYNLKTKEKKLVKEQIIPSGHNSNDYIVERLECEGHDGRIIPITITRKKTTKLDGNSNLLLYGYGSYGNSMWPSFSSTRLSLINRDIIWATAHIRGGMERGMRWWKEGKLLNKKNTFQDYISCAKFLIDKKYTSKKKIIGMGGSAGGLLMGAVVNEKPDLFLGMIMAVPFVDSLTTNLDHSLPLTIGEFDEFGNAKDNKEHFEYIYSYAPYNNIKKMDYPNILITTSLSDNRVLFDEPLKFTAKLRDNKTDNNLLLLKTEMNAGHGGKSGRDGIIEEIAFDYAFICKIANKI